MAFLKIGSAPFRIAPGIIASGIGIAISLSFKASIKFIPHQVCHPELFNSFAGCERQFSQVLERNLLSLIFAALSLLYLLVHGIFAAFVRLRYSEPSHARYGRNVIFAILAMPILLFVAFVTCATVDDGPAGLTLFALSAVFLISSAVGICKRSKPSLRKPIGT